MERSRRHAKVGGHAVLAAVTLALAAPPGIAGPGSAAAPSRMQRLVADDVTSPPPPPVLISDPARLDVALTQSDATTSELIVTNTGDDPIRGLRSTYVDETAERESVVEVVASPGDCLPFLDPGEPCTVSLTVTPLRLGESVGHVKLSGSIGSQRPDPGLSIPARWSVVSTTETSTTTTTTAKTSPPGSVTSSPPPSSGGPGGLPTWLLSAPFLAFLSLVVAAGALGVALMASRAQSARGHHRASAQKPPTTRPQVRVRPGPRRDLVALPEEPVLTLVVAAPPASTTVTEDQR